MALAARADSIIGQSLSGRIRAGGAGLPDGRPKTMRVRPIDPQNWPRGIEDRGPSAWRKRQEIADGVGDEPVQFRNAREGRRCCGSDWPRGRHRNQHVALAYRPRIR